MTSFRPDYNKLIWPSGVVLLTLIVSYLIFKDYLFNPNQYVFAFGGDALTIYYNIAFHVCHDSGVMLTGMNYPHGEYIVLTDAQGAVSTVLQFVNKYFFDVCDCVPGIIHSVNIFLLPLCSLFLYYILRYFNVREISALVFAVLITFLSPHMLRFGGHFGLAYPFVIPMAMLWAIRKHNITMLEKRDALVFATLLFFTFNNPYIGFGASGFLIVAGALYALFGIKDRDLLKKAFIIGGVGLFAALLPFLNFNFFDPFADRIKQQWGFFVYNSSIEGLFYPPGSILHKLLTSMNFSIKDSLNESWLNIGLTCTLLLTALILGLIVKILRKQHTGINSKLFNTELRIMLGSAAIMFLYSANSNLLGFTETWMENNLGPLLMFKASGRIGWSFYFALALTCVVYLEFLLKKIKLRYIPYVILLILVSIWIYEVQQYVGNRYKDVFHGNHFRPHPRNEILAILHDNNINANDFQAMLVLPKMMAWSDNFISDILWSSQFYSMRISDATGLPMISAMLSRMSVSEMAKSIQMLSHPFIEKELLKELPNQKDILLLLGSEHPPLKIGEQYLIDISTPLYTSTGFSLYRLQIEDIKQNKHIQEARRLSSEGGEKSPDQILHFSFDEEKSPFSFYGHGSKLVKPGMTLMVDHALPESQDSFFVFSAWAKFDDQKPGVGDWEINIIDSLGQNIFTTNIETRRSNDIQGMWIRGEALIPAAKGAKIQAKLKSTKELYIDEILIYPESQKTIITLPESDEFLINGYKISKEPLDRIN